MKRKSPAYEGTQTHDHPFCYCATIAPLKILFSLGSSSKPKFIYRFLVGWTLAVAQRLEHRPTHPEVVGSNPPWLFSFTLLTFNLALNLEGASLHLMLKKHTMGKNVFGILRYEVSRRPNVVFRVSLYERLLELKWLGIKFRTSASKWFSSKWVVPTKLSGILTSGILNPKEAMKLDEVVSSGSSCRSDFVKQRFMNIFAAWITT